MSVSTSNRTCNKTLLEIWQKKENNELEKRNRAFLINQDENGIARVNVRFEGEDVWLNVEQSDHGVFDLFWKQSEACPRDLLNDVMPVASRM